MTTASVLDQSIRPSESSHWTRRAAPKAAFVLFLLTNLALFIRPADIVPRLEHWPIYEVLFLASLALSWRAVLEQLALRSLRDHPITACVVCLLPAVVLSHVSHAHFPAACESVIEFLKLLLYYLLLVAVVNTPNRLRLFLYCVAIFACVQIGVAVLQEHGFIDLAALRPVEEQAIVAASGEQVTQFRMCGTGIFHDPNDLAVLASVAVVICLYGLTDPAARKWVRIPLCLAAMILCAHAIWLTQSRGGFIALLAGLGVLCVAHFGFVAGAVLAGVAALGLAAMFSGRQTDIGMLRRTTAQMRLGFWEKGLSLFAGAPIFGIGQGTFKQIVGYVAHNSFIHCFVELGFVGGCLFLGAFYLAVWQIWQLRNNLNDDVELRRLHPFLIAAISTWAFGMLSLSRSYVPPTYMILGLATVYLGMAGKESPASRWRVDALMIARIAALGIAFLASAFLFVHMFLRVRS